MTGPETRMLAALVPESPNLGDEWTVVDVETGGCGPDPDEPRACVERTPGHATGCPRSSPAVFCQVVLNKYRIEI